MSINESHCFDMFSSYCTVQLSLSINEFHSIAHRIADKTAIDPIEICTTLTTALRGNGLVRKDNLGRTPLHWAAYRGAGTCCMHLIQVGRWIRSVLLPKWFLSNALFLDWLYLFVLQKGIDVDAVDDLGNTPIAYAAMNGHERLEFVSPLIS